MNSTSEFENKCCAFTIIARNYLATAIGMAESFCLHNPGVTLFIYVVDRSTEEIEKFKFLLNGKIELCGNDLIDIESSAFFQMALMYDVTEFATALKPTIALNIVNLGFDYILYLDPDLFFYSTIRYLFNLLTEEKILLTPHLLKPLPEDGYLPSEKDILAVGTFNLGFIGFSSSNINFLKEWEIRLRYDCVRDVNAGLFVDQKWIDFAPSFFNTNIIKDPGVNVAYWNIHERQIEFDGLQYFVENTELKFFHFSGIPLNNTALFSKYFGALSRIQMLENVTLRQLFKKYRNVINDLEKSILEIDNDSNYRFGQTVSNIVLDISIRRLIRQAIIARHPLAKVLFEDSTIFNNQDQLLIRWLNRPDYRALIQEKSSGVLTLYQYMFYLMHDNLQAEFKDPLNRDMELLIKWFETFGSEEDIDVCLRGKVDVPPGAIYLADRRIETDLLPSALPEMNDACLVSDHPTTELRKFPGNIVVAPFGSDNIFSLFGNLIASLLSSVNLPVERVLTWKSLVELYGIPVDFESVGMLANSVVLSIPLTELDVIEKFLKDYQVNWWKSIQHLSIDTGSVYSTSHSAVESHYGGGELLKVLFVPFYPTVTEQISKLKQLGIDKLVALDSISAAELEEITGISTVHLTDCNILDLIESDSNNSIFVENPRDETAKDILFNRPRTSTDNGEKYVYFEKPHIPSVKDMSDQYFDRNYIIYLPLKSDSKMFQDYIYVMLATLCDQSQSLNEFVFIVDLKVPLSFYLESFLRNLSRQFNFLHFNKSYINNSINFMHRADALLNIVVNPNYDSLNIEENIINSQKNCPSVFLAHPRLSKMLYDSRHNSHILGIRELIDIDRLPDYNYHDIVTFDHSNVVYDVNKLVIVLKSLLCGERVQDRTEPTDIRKFDEVLQILMDQNRLGI